MPLPSVHSARRIRGLLERLRAHQDGATAVEFALLLPVLMIMLAGLIDATRLISHTMKVKAAAQAGADYAQGRGWKPTEIAAAVTGATQLAVAATPSPTVTTACVSGQSIVQTTATTCSTGGPPGRFVTVGARAPFTPLIPWPGIRAPAEIKAQALVRIP